MRSSIRVKYNVPDLVRRSPAGTLFGRGARSSMSVPVPPWVRPPRPAPARPPLTQQAIVAAERLMAIARAGGLPDRAIAYLVDLLALYVGAIGYEDTLAAAAHGLPSQDALAERLAQMRDYFASLPPERFPNSVALAGLIAAGDT